MLDDDDILLEPSCFAWALQGLPPPPLAVKGAGGGDVSGGGGGDGGDGEKGGGGGGGGRGGGGGDNMRGGKAGGSIGSNFPLPHRDYSAKEAWTADDGDGDGGEPNLLCVWMPVTDATLDSGCLYVLPRGADKCWNDPTHPDHLRPAEAEPGGGAALHFPLACARPLPALAGSVCAWAGNTVHWGAACRVEREESVNANVYDDGKGHEPGVGDGAGAGGRERSRERPRHSLACTFRKRGAPDFCGSLEAMTREQCTAMDVSARVRLVAQSLVLYSRWYELPPELPGLLD